jgi:hypothetical protein
MEKYSMNNKLGKKWILDFLFRIHSWWYYKFHKLLTLEIMCKQDKRWDVALEPDLV